MDAKASTTNLLHVLTESKDLREYIETNRDSFVNDTLSDFLNRLLQEKGMRKTEAIKRAELNENYVFQIFSGLRKTISRDKLICLGIGLQLTAPEADRLLKLAGLAPLYPKIKRDSIVLYGLINRQSVSEINHVLYENGEKTL